MNRILSILLLFSVISCNNDRRTINTTVKKSENYTLYSNSTFKMFTKLKTLAQYKLENSNRNVFVYEKIDETFVDAYDYEPRYTEVLIFEFDPNVETFKYADKELGEINCKYSWEVLTKIPELKVKDIKKGFISGKRISKDTWEIVVEIDTDFRFGGYLEKQKARKIKFTKTIKITPRNKVYKSLYYK
ncbi:MAG: hypothetical protein GXO80_10835 [Chlorobi bacterium]|nr:hypothetical protein [Chlorobiota bacterium]